MEITDVGVENNPERECIRNVQNIGTLFLSATLFLLQHKVVRILDQQQIDWACLVPQIPPHRTMLTSILVFPYNRFPVIQPTVIIPAHNGGVNNGAWMTDGAISSLLTETRLPDCNNEKGGQIVLHRSGIPSTIHTN